MILTRRNEKFNSVKRLFLKTRRTSEERLLKNKYARNFPRDSPTVFLGQNSSRRVDFSYMAAYHHHFSDSRDCRSVHLSLIACARRFTYVNASLGEQGAAKGVAAVRENAPQETIIPFLRRARAAYRATLYLLSARVRLITSSEFNGVHKSLVQCWEALKTAISGRMSSKRYAAHFD